MGRSGDCGSGLDHIYVQIVAVSSFSSAARSTGSFAARTASCCADRAAATSPTRR